MNIVHGDIWEYARDCAIVIPTNGFVKTNGEAVMGRGLAYQLSQKIPSFPKTLGNRLRAEGNHVHEFIPLFQLFPKSASKKMPTNIFTFPVKDFWGDKAELHLIQRSCQELLMKLGNRQQEVAIPQVGCGNGGRSWQEVRPILEQELGEDSRFLILI